MTYYRHGAIDGRRQVADDNFDSLSVSALSLKSSRSVAAKANKHKQNRTIVSKRIEDVYGAQRQREYQLKKATSLHSLQSGRFTPEPHLSEGYAQYAQSQYTLSPASVPVTSRPPQLYSSQTLTRRQVLEEELRKHKEQSKAKKSSIEDDMTLESTDGNWTIRTDPRATGGRGKSKRGAIPFSEYREEQNNNSHKKVDMESTVVSSGPIAVAMGGIPRSQTPVQMVDIPMDRPATHVASAMGGVTYVQQQQQQQQQYYQQHQQHHQQHHQNQQPSRPQTPTHMVVAKIGEPLQIHVPQPQRLPNQQHATQPQHTQMLNSNGFTTESSTLQRRYMRRVDTVDGTANGTMNGATSLVKAQSVPDLLNDKPITYVKHKRPVTPTSMLEQSQRPITPTSLSQRPVTPTQLGQQPSVMAETLPRNYHSTSKTQVQNHFSTLPKNMSSKGLIESRTNDVYRGEVVSVNVPSYNTSGTPSNHQLVMTEHVPAPTQLRYYF